MPNVKKLTDGEHSQESCSAESRVGATKTGSPPKPLAPRFSATKGTNNLGLSTPGTVPVILRSGMSELMDGGKWTSLMVYNSQESLGVCGV